MDVSLERFASVSPPTSHAAEFVGMDTLASTAGALHLWDLDHGYDTRGLLASRVDGIPRRRVTFLYDELSRLLTVSEGAVVRERDASGRRATKRGREVDVTYFGPAP